jgi:hypothetical protein
MTLLCSSKLSKTLEERPCQPTQSGEGGPHAPPPWSHAHHQEPSGKDPLLCHFILRQAPSDVVPRRPYLASSSEVPNGVMTRAFVSPPHRPEQCGPLISISTPEIRSPRYSFIYLNPNHGSWIEWPRMNPYAVNPWASHMDPVHHPYGPIPLDIIKKNNSQIHRKSLGTAIL